MEHEDETDRKRERERNEGANLEEKKREPPSSGLTSSFLICDAVPIGSCSSLRQAESDGSHVRQLGARIVDLEKNYCSSVTQTDMKRATE